MPLSTRRLLQDICGILVLTVVSIGLAVFTRDTNTSYAKRRDALPPSLAPSGSKVINLSALPHPVFTLSDLKRIVRDHDRVIIDARAPSEYEEGHVPGALNVPAANFDAAYARLNPIIRANKSRPLLVYCSNLWCGLGDELQQKLINQGHQHVGRFPEGWDAWVGAGLPVEKSP